MKFLVTGGAGYIGSHMAHLLIENGHEVVVVDNLSLGNKTLVPERAKFFQEDIGNYANILKILNETKPDAVFHFAAYARVEESVSEPLKYFSNNTSNTINLIQACLDANMQRFIFSSTAAVYGTPNTDTVTENSPIQPESPYGESKAMVEKILQDVSKSNGLKYIILRYFNVAGARLDLKTGQISKHASHLIKIACEAGLGKRAGITIFGEDYPTADGSCVRDYIHVQDLVEAHLCAYDYLAKTGQSDIFNLGYGHGYSVKQVLNEFEMINSLKLNKKMGARRPGDPSQIVSDPSRAMKVLGWKPQHDSLSEICRSAYQWEKKLGSRD